MVNQLRDNAKRIDVIKARIQQGARVDLPKSESAIVEKAFQIIEARCKRDAIPITDSTMPVNLFATRIGNSEVEHFAVMFLNARNRLIAIEVMSSGTPDATAVFHSEIARRALQLHAVSVIIGHNHPSGVVTPSDADKIATRKCARALETIGVRLLDHVIVGGNQSYSFAEYGERSLKP